MTVGAATLALGGKILGANDRVRVAICGVRGRGNDHLHGFARVPGTEIAAMCDVDEGVLNQRLGDAEKLGLAKPKSYVDVRRLLEDKDIDAISIATPNHWHALMGIWACQAGKDVYVEKPCSHNWFEGRQLVRAVKKYNRICQHGSQSRSNPGMLQAMQRLRDGTIGNVYLARALCYKWRPSIGHTGVEPVPAGVDYDLWTGPAPLKPFTRNRFHYNWHWFWDTGNGDLGNQGIHEVDISRWGLGVTHPTKVSAIGGKFMFDDDQETPNTITATYDFVVDGRPKMMSFEVRHWYSNHEAGINGERPGNTIGNTFYGAKGYLAIDNYNKYYSFMGPKQEPGPAKSAGGNHFANFIAAVRSRKHEDLNADIEEGALSCNLMHLANISYRLGRTLHWDEKTWTVKNDPEANKMLTREYRKPYVVPEKV